MDTLLLRLYEYNAFPYFMIYPPEYHQTLEYFKQEYYNNASFDLHIEYIDMLEKYRKFNQNYPDRRTFLLMCRKPCFCEFYTTDEEYIQAAEFFMRETGELMNISCAHFYFFSQFYILERRNPTSVEEFTLFLRRSIMAMSNPEAFENDKVPKAVSSDKINELRNRVFTFTYTYKHKENKEEKEEKEICSICQEDLENNEKCLRLTCGHYYHAEEKNCCENGSIFKWFENNKICPVCRTEV